MEELPEYARATHFLGTLGMQNYQKNLKRGLLNDSTLHLWNERCCPESHTMMSTVDSFLATEESASAWPSIRLLPENGTPQGRTLQLIPWMH